MLCKECMDKVHVGEAAITEYVCEKCGRTNLYMFTDTPKICPACSVKFKICERCGTKITGKQVS